MDDIKTTMRLVGKAKAGDDHAMNLLFARYFPRVLKIVRLSLGKGLRRRMESMDVLQNVMKRAIQDFSDFKMESEAAFLHWLARLVKNQLCDDAAFHEAQKRDVGKEAQAVDPALLTNPADVQGQARPDFDEGGDIHDLLQLEEALGKISEEQREILIMHEYTGLTFREIAKNLRCTEDAVRMKLARTIDQLTDFYAAP